MFIFTLLNTDTSLYILDCFGISSSNLGEEEKLFETIHSVQGGRVQMHVESYLPEELHVAVGMMLPGVFTNESFVRLVCCLGDLQMSCFSSA